MKTQQEIFKEVLEELGFANYKPNQMTNSDYWLCTTTAMEKYASQTLEEVDKKLKNLPITTPSSINYRTGYNNAVQELKNIIHEIKLGL